MNPLFYTLLVQKKLPAAAASVKPVIKYHVRRVVKNHVIKYISTPIIEEPELQSSEAVGLIESYDCYG
jgi:hypothetical protein